MVLLQTILLLLIVYYVFKILWRWLSPKLFNYAVRKTEERFGQGFGGFGQARQHAKTEGKTTILKRKPTQRKTTKTVGEYIDFEEID